MKIFPTAIVLACSFFLVGCEDSDFTQRRQQEVILREATSQTGMPAIRSFRERKLLKMILEKRDQVNLQTYTYTYAEDSGEVKFFCNSVGFGIPYATQYTNPQKIDGGVSVPQADPSGLFSPESADASWVMCKTPSGELQPVYLEPKIIVTTYKL